MDNRPWASEEVALLKDKYDKWYMKTIAEELDRTEQSVRMKAYKLGLVKQGNRKQFSEDEIDYIMENYPTVSTRIIAEKVNCSETRIYSFARQMGIEKENREVHWTDEDIEFLKNHLDMPYEDLTKALKKSKERVYKKIKELGLRKLIPSDWTPEQDQMLKDNLGSLTVGRLSKLIGKSIPAIRTRCKRLGLFEPALMHPGWTEEHDQLLRDDNGFATISETAEKLGRAYSSIRSRKIRLGLTTNFEDIPDHEPVIRRLVGEKKYVEEIAKETGFTIKNLIRYGFENNIPIKSEPKRLSSEIRACRYGFEDEVDLKSKKLLFIEWYRHWAKTFRMDGVAEGTRSRYFYIYCNIYENKLGQMRLKDIRRSDVQAYANDFGKDHAKKTVFAHMQILRSCMKDAMAEGLIEFNPAANIQMTYTEQRLSPMELKKKREEKKWLEVNEYQVFKQHLIMKLQRALYEKPDYGPYLGGAKKATPVQTLMVIILVALKTGMRFSEILGLTRDDILTETSELVVDKTWGYRVGKDHHKFLPTKNISSIRHVAVDPEMMIMLDLYIRWQDEHNVETLENTLFNSPYGDIFNSTINKKMAELLEEIGIKPLTLHKLRHTHASYLIAKKVPIEVVAKRLGHTDTNMIRKTYGHLLKETEEKGISQILSLI